MTGSRAVREAARIIRAGGIAAVPTETVYGLAANALDASACARIFEAKNRPQDNPLIVHVADLDGAKLVWSDITATAKRLMDAFWPGPLSIILPKRSIVPNTVSAGLDTVAVRMPSNSTVRDIIREAGVPLAAPSANSSGRPSPTEAAHVMEDLSGKIPLIVDDGPCTVGVESTVVDLTGDVPVILRPGDITAEDIGRIAGTVLFRDGSRDTKPASPGMKYRHYSPRARVVVLGPGGAPIAKSINSMYHTHKDKGENPTILCLEQDADAYSGLNVRLLGHGMRDAEHTVFRELRNADERGSDIVLIHASELMGAAVLDRIMRAGGKAVPRA